MADPGLAPVPPIPEGQQKLQILQAGGAKTGDLLQYKQQQTELLRSGGVDQNGINRYWGDVPPAATNITNASAGNLQRTVAAHGNADTVLSTASNFLGSAWNMTNAASANVNQHIATTKAGMNASFWGSLDDADANFRAMGPGADGSANNPFDAAAHLGGAALALGSAAWTAATTWVAPVQGLAGALLDPAARSVTVPKMVLPWGTVDQHPLSGDMIASNAVTVAGFMLGRPHAQTPVIPENIRYAAIQDTHTGALPGGPAEAAGRLLGENSPVAKAVAAATPSATDFERSAQVFLNTHQFDTGTDVARITKNLQQLWVSTGLTPQELVAKAATNPDLRAELIQQDISGEPIAPHALVQAPKPPQPYLPSTSKAALMTGASRPPLAAAAGEFVNSPDMSLQILGQLEGSPSKNGVGQISSANARGKYQIEPSTAAHYGFTDIERLTNDDAYNTQAARAIVADLYRRYNGNMEAISIAYNDGPKRANEWLNAGAGYRLEASRDNSMRSGWRYDRVAADRDESFMPVETQKYVARARFKMGKPEEEAPAAPTKTFPSFDENAKPGDAMGTVKTEEEAPATEEVQRSGSVSAASIWDDAPVEQAYEELASNIGEERLPAVKGMSGYDQFITSTMSRLQPFKALDDVLAKMGALDPDKEMGLRDYFAQTTKADQRAFVAANHGTISGPELKDVNLEGPTARGAIELAKKNGGNTEDFLRWLVARRTGVLERNKKNSGFNPMAAARIMSDAGEAAKYADAAKVWDGYTDGVLDYAQASGRYSADAVKAMKDVGSWVSFRRLVGDDVSFQGPGKGFGIGNPLKRMEGSNKQITDPLVASLDNARLTIQSADRNFATGKLIEHAETNPQFAALVGLEKVGMGKAADMDAIDNALKAYGIPEDQMDAAREAFGTLVQEREQLRNNEFPYYRDGVREVWKTGWPELVRAIQGSTPVQANLLVKVFQNIASAVRTGVVAVPSFAVKTFASHQLIQYINNPLRPPPFLTGFDGLMKMAKAKDLLVDAMAKGALGTSMEAMDKDMLYETMTTVLGQTGVLDRVRNDISQYKEAPSVAAAAKLGLNGVLAPVRLARALQEHLDFGNRVGVKAVGERAGLSPQKAAANAAEAGIDYTNGPADPIVSWWSSMVPFMRPSLLYSENALKAIERNPAAYAAAATAAVTVPTTLLTALNLMQDAIPAGQPGAVPESEKFKNIQNWEKMYYYIGPYMNGQRLKLRLPASAGFAFGAVPQAIIQAMHDHNPVQFKEIFQAFMREYVPPFSPPAITPGAEVLTNTNFQTWQPLVPESLRKANGELQYTTATSAPARALASLLGPTMRRLTNGQLDTPSPIALDHMVEGWTGTAGQLALQAASAATGRPGPPMDLASIPFAHDFLLMHPGEGQAIEDFYDEKAKFEKAIASKTALRHELKRGDLSNQAETTEVMRYAAAGQKLDGPGGVAQALTNQRSLIWGVYENKQMTNDEKSQAIHSILAQEIVLARGWTAVMKGFDSAEAKAQTQPEQ